MHHFLREGIVLARKWLRSKADGVKQFNTVIQERDNNGKFEPVDDSYRSIARFLLKNLKESRLGELLENTQPRFSQGNHGKIKGEKTLPSGLNKKQSHYAQDDELRTEGER